MSNEHDPPGEQHTSNRRDSPTNFRQAIIDLLPKSWLDIIASIGLLAGLLGRDATILMLFAGYLFRAGVEKMNQHRDDHTPP